MIIFLIVIAIIICFVVLWVSYIHLIFNRIDEYKDVIDILLSIVSTVIVPLVIWYVGHNLSTVLKKKEKIFDKRQVLYPELYEKMERAKSAILWFYGRFVRQRTYEDYNKEDIERECKNLELNSMQTDDILELWDTDLDKAVKKIRFYYRQRELFECERLYNIFHNFVVFKKFFFSDEIMNIIEEIKDPLDKFHRNNDFTMNNKIDDLSFSQQIRNENEKYREIIKNNAEKLENRIKQELL